MYLHLPYFHLSSTFLICLFLRPFNTFLQCRYNKSATATNKPYVSKGITIFTNCGYKKKRRRERMCVADLHS